MSIGPRTAGVVMLALIFLLSWTADPREQADGSISQEQQHG